MKAIILTNIALNDAEERILKETDIFKAALNHHAEEYNPGIRIISDYVLEGLLRKFPEKIISVRAKLRYDSKRVEYFNSEYKGATIISAVEYLISKNFNKILIVGDNSVNTSEFQNLVNIEMDKLMPEANIYQCTNGNFNLPVMSIEKFCTQVVR